MTPALSQAMSRSKARLSGVLSRLSSLKLALALLLALAALAAVGTFDLLPQRLAPEEYAERYGAAGPVLVWLGLDAFHTSLLYRLLIALFLANLAACGLKRGMAGFREAFGRGLPAESVELKTSEEEAARRLSAAGYAILSAAPLRARRRAFAFLGFPLVHLAIAPLVAGAFWGSVGGRIATQNVSVGRLTDRMYDWSARDERVMPFALELREFRLLRYPSLHVKVRPLTAAGLGDEVETEPGRPFAVPGTAFSALLENFDPRTGDMTYRIVAEGRSLGPYSRGREEGAPVRLRPQSFREGEGEIKRAEAVVRFHREGGVPPVEAVVAVNEPATVGGYRVFLTSWGKDDQGVDFAGFQATSDPGQGLVWVFSVVLTLGVFLMLFGSGAWVEADGGRLVGRASRDRRAFGDFLRGVAAATPREPQGP